MNPCKRIGLDVTWQCNWNCLHCFYRHGDMLHKNIHVPLNLLLRKIDRGRMRGLDHVVLEGWGEPSLYNELDTLAHAIIDRGMTWSMITNGTTGLDRFRHMYSELGIDHVHISSHGNLEEVSERKNVSNKQRDLKEYLASEGLPFRTNVTLQQATYRQLVETIEEDIQFGSRHLVLLGFLPHYEWPGKIQDVAVHPGTLRPHIEDAAALILEHERLLTIRYHPLCHLKPELWPYVTNTLHVFFDPWEWNYELQAIDEEDLWKAGAKMNFSVDHEPCRTCAAYAHCGGVNRKIAETFDGAGLDHIHAIPEQYKKCWGDRGGLHDLNPANSERGYFSCR